MLWENIEDYYGGMDPRTFFIGRPTNMSCHNMCFIRRAPVGVEHLLGLGSKFCVKTSKLRDETVGNMMERLRTNVRWKYIFRDQPDDNDYIPGLHINTDKLPGKSSKGIEHGMSNFERAIWREQKRYRSKKICPNLTPMQQALTRRLKKNEEIKVIMADKNCGDACIDTEHLTERGVTEHLGNSKVYIRMTKKEAYAHLAGVERMVASFASKWQDNLSKAEHTYLRRGIKKYRGKLARFYMTIKVHKDPYKFRPIVATCGTVLSALSSWLDYKLQQLKPYISTYIKDSDDFRKQVHELGPLPPNARIITADAKSMYTNIDTDHALEILRSFLEELEAEGKLPLDFDIDMILEAAALVMRWNIFEFGDCYFKQLIGTAMGTAAAVLWAIIYYYWHEKHVLIAKWSKKMPLLKRFVDDIFAIIKVGGQDGMTADEWKIFKNDINSFGILEWDIDEPSKQVDFLDLTLWIDGDKILTKTYQKPINLYQYITPTSAHPPGMIKGMIFGSLRRYFEQNSRTEDFWTIAMQLYHRLKARGWDRATLEPIFIAAYQRIQSPRQH